MRITPVTIGRGAVMASKHFYSLSIGFLVICVSACGGGGSDTSGPTATVNTAPQLTGVMEYSVDENTTDVATIQASDAEGDAISYSLSGEDAAAFSIDATSGELTFVKAPDYEAPTDSNGDNDYGVTVSASDGSASSSLGIVVTVADAAGQKMVLTGNSFFKPYAERIGSFASDAGFSDHSDTGVFAGGDRGVPKYLWSNPSAANQENKQQIQAALDDGGVDVFGMTGSNIAESENPTDGYREWIAYALEKNPDVDILISIPQIDFPADWAQRAQDAGFTDIDALYSYFVNDMMNQTLIDQLRLEFPSTHIFSIPTGKSSKVLAQMYQSGTLLDDVLAKGPFEDSLFTDEKGHQGKIIVTTGTLMWLNGLYEVDLSSYQADTGFETDLHAIASEIMEQHDPNYRR
jgi:hypothetical protein